MLHAINMYLIVSMVNKLLRVKNNRGALLEAQNGTQKDLNEDLFNFGGQKVCLHAERGTFEMEPNKIWIKW